MNRLAANAVLLIGVMCLGGCQTSKETRVDSGPDMAQAITALRGAYAAFNRGDMDAAVESLDAQIDWTEPVEFSGGGRPYHGREEVKGYLTQSRAGWVEGGSEPERFITAGDRIVVLVHARFRLKGNSEWQEVRLADVYTVRDAKIVQMRAFADRQEALRWVGIADPGR
jgi:ketosteroid isomerase-like protein